MVPEPRGFDTRPILIILIGIDQGSPRGDHGVIHFQLRPFQLFPYWIQSDSCRKGGRARFEVPFRATVPSRQDGGERGECAKCTVMTPESPGSGCSK